MLCNTIRGIRLEILYEVESIVDDYPSYKVTHFQEEENLHVSDINVPAVIQYLWIIPFDFFKGIFSRSMAMQAPYCMPYMMGGNSDGKSMFCMK